MLQLIVYPLIKEYEKANIIPKWSCNVDNKASLATGLGIGFEIESYYTFLVPADGNVLYKNH